MKRLYFALLFSFILSWCSKDKDQYIARVGPAYLTREKLSQMLPDEGLSNKLSKNYINSVVSAWVTREILFQKAKQYHFEREENIKAKVADFYRDLTIDAFTRYYLQTNVTISESEIRDYYLKNKNSFIRDRDEAKITHVLVQDFNDAMAVKTALQNRKKGELDALIKKYNFESKIIRRGESLGEIDQNVFEAGLRVLIGPIASSYGYHIIEVLERYQAGSLRSIDMVRDEIMQTLTQVKIQKNYNQLVDSLVNNADFEIRDENIANFLSSR